MCTRPSFCAMFSRHSFTQSRRDRAQMALKSRSHEILMAEMAVLVKRYRRDRGRLYEVNRTLVKRLAELEAQVRKQYRRRAALSLLPLLLNSKLISRRVQASHVTVFMHSFCACALGDSMPRDPVLPNDEMLNIATTLSSTASLGMRFQYIYFV